MSDNSNNRMLAYIHTVRHLGAQKSILFGTCVGLFFKMNVGIFIYVSFVFELIAQSSTFKTISFSISVFKHIFKAI